MGAKYLNNQGERFLARYDPERMEMTTRDIQSRAMFMEIQAGRGSEHGGVYLDCRGLADYDGKSAETIVRTQGGCVSDYLKVAGVDILTQVVELAPAAHFGIGGVRINEKAETSLQGLYAAGEVSGGLHGANRLAANSMPEIFVFGGIAGESASRYVAQAGPPPAETCWAFGRDSVQRAFGLLENAGGGTRVREAKAAIESIMFDCFGIVRDGEGMRRGLDRLDDVESGEMADLLIQDRNPVMNYDWVEALESERMITTGRILGAGALNRQESRGAHYRSDIPQASEAWQKNTVIWRYGSEMRIRLCDPDERWQA
jgi:succinate dehydrogenase/fumarate reductase flavoprotein subunit